MSEAERKIQLFGTLGSAEAYAIAEPLPLVRLAPIFLRDPTQPKHSGSG